MRPDAINRVLLVVHANALGGIGGMETVCVDLGIELRRRGIEVAAIVPEGTWANPLADRFRTAGVRIGRLDTDPFLGRLDPVRGRLAQAWRLVRLWRLLQRWRPDVVHLHVPLAATGLSVIVVARMAGAIIVSQEHNVPEPIPLLRTRLAARAINRLAHFILSVSRYNASHRRSRLDDVPARHAAVLNGIPIPAVAPEIRQANRARVRGELGIGRDDIVIGCLVRLVEGKGLDDLLRAFALVRSEHPCRLLLVGEGPLRSELESLARTLGIASNVHFMGNQTEPMPYLDAMDVFALAVPAGSMSIALLEAMGRGLPPVITFCGPEEAVIDEETGLCAPPNDPAGLAAALKRLVTDAALRDRLATSAAAHVRRHFSIVRVVDDYLELYAVARSTQVPDRLRADGPPNPRPAGCSDSCARPQAGSRPRPMADSPLVLR